MTEADKRRKMRKKADRLNERGTRCYLCNGAFGHETYLWPTRDHVVPLSHPEFQTRWKHKRENIKWAHFLCNQNKANMPVELYRMTVMFASTEGGEMQHLGLKLKSPALAKALEEFR